ncbi:hypothetical protein PFISCL1PPCAC_671, partial [Pristionchus fissidentatus]
MADEEETLDFRRQWFGAIPNSSSGTYCFQTDDGTILHFDTTQKRLFVITDGDEVVAILPAGETKPLGMIENSLFLLEKNSKIHKATFQPPLTIRVEFVRNLEKDEKHQFGTLFICSQKVQWAVMEG